VSNLIEGILERGVELQVVERESHLAGEFGERLVVLFLEGSVAGNPAHDDHSEEFP